jgi:RecG-like helicase
VIAEQDLQLRGPGDFFGTGSMAFRRCAWPICIPIMN